MKLLEGHDLAHDVIESIVSLTEQRDQHSLEQSLFATLEEMLDGVSGWLMDAPQPETNGTECAVLRGDKSTIPATLLKLGCHLPEDAATRMVEVEGRTYLLAKLQGSRQGRFHLLILTKDEWASIDQQLVKGMVQVYKNFIGVLYDSEKDTLTGLYNRRKLDAKLKEQASARLQGRRCNDKDHQDFLALLDLDRFKHINDTYGHLIGDEVLLTFSNIMRRTLRDNDLQFRYGGEEFVVLLHDIEPKAAHKVLERIRRDVEKHAFPQVGTVTVSTGYAVLDHFALPVHSIEKADRALYYAKEHGRNRTCSFEQLVADKAIEDTHLEGSIELF